MPDAESLATVEALNEELSNIVADVCLHWNDPYKAPELKVGLGQEAINAFARTLSEYAAKLGLVRAPDA